MVKTDTEKQKEYRELGQAKQNSDYLKKDRERKRVKRELWKKSAAQHQEYKQKDCERKATPKKFSKQALGKAKHRTSKHLPRSLEKRKHVIIHLSLHLSQVSLHLVNQMCTKKFALQVLLVTGEDLLILTLLKINCYRF